MPDWRECQQAGETNESRRECLWAKRVFVGMCLEGCGPLVSREGCALCDRPDLITALKECGHEANGYNCPDVTYGECGACKGDDLRRAALAKVRGLKGEG